MDIRRIIHFDLKPYQKKKIYYQLRMRVSYNKARLDFCIGYSLLNPDDWDKQKQMVKPNRLGVKNASAKQINHRIQEYYSVIEDCFKYYEFNNKVPYPFDLKKRFLTIIKPQAEDLPLSLLETKSNKKSFWDVFDEFTTEEGQEKDWRDGSYKKFKTLRKDLYEFDKKLTFDSLNESGLVDFMVYLREKKTVSPSKSKVLTDGTTEVELQGLKNSTINKKIKYLKWFLKWATKKKYNDVLDFQDFQPALKTPEKDVIYLNQQELLKLYELKFNEDNEHLEKVRDVFLFCCFTGLRYSDALNLKHSYDKGDYLNIVTIKTLKKIKIPVCIPAREILDKYANVPFEDDKALPCISNQKANVYIKDICKLAEINTPYVITEMRGSKRTEKTYYKYSVVSSHTARKSFVCFAAANHVDRDIIMKITGHSTYEAMEPYITIADESTQEIMEKFNNCFKHSST